jgi:hypothetical protein
MQTLTPVPDFIDTYAADDGSIWTARKGRLRRAKQHPHSKGYVVVNVRRADTGRVRPALVHRLVCAAYHGPCPAGSQTRHLNGSPTDNRPENLAWGTPRENYDDRDRHGRTCAGERHHAATLTTQDVVAIRHMAAMGVKGRAIAKYFGATKATVSAIVLGKTWKSVGGPIRERK